MLIKVQCIPLKLFNHHRLLSVFFALRDRFEARFTIYDRDTW
jgi:hypothetical protein